MFTTHSSIRALALGLGLAAAGLLSFSGIARAEDSKTVTKTKTKVEVKVEGEVLPADLRAPTVADLPAPTNCVYIEQTDAQGSACRALLHNACARPVNVKVQHEINFIKFNQTGITSAGVNADHHGEPAAGFFAPAGTFMGTMTAQIAPGSSRWFERFHKGADFHVDNCRVSFTSAF